MIIDNDRIVVGTSTPVRVFSCKVKNIQSFEIYALGALELGIESVSIGSGMPLAAGENFSMSHLDFRKDDKELQESQLEFFAIAANATSCHVSQVLKS